MAPSFEPFTRLADDLAKMATGAAGAAANLRSEMSSLVKHRFDSLLESMDLVAREDYAALEEMVATLRKQQEALIARVEALEALELGKRPPVAEAKAAKSKAAKVKPPEAATSEAALDAVNSADAGSSADADKPKRARKPKAEAGDNGK